MFRVKLAIISGARLARSSAAWSRQGMPFSSRTVRSSTTENCRRAAEVQGQERRQAVVGALPRDEPQ